MTRSAKNRVPRARQRGRHHRRDDVRSIALTLDNIEQNELTVSERDVLANDRERWKRMGAGSHLDEWLSFGPGLMIRRHLAMKLAHTNRPEGRAYNENMSALMVRDGFYSAKETKNSGIKLTMTAVLWLHDEPERLIALREIRDTMTPGERARLNSPISARQRVEKLLKAREGGTEEKQKDSPVKLLKDKIAVLESDLAKANAKLAKRDDGSLFDLKNDSAEDIIAAVLANVSTYKADVIQKGLADGVKRKRQRPAG
jgi:hypothetical protein